jgi:hypothetical protein
LTIADRRVLTDISLATQRRADEIVEVRFIEANDASADPTANAEATGAPAPPS